MLVFATVNGLLLYWVSGRFRHAVKGYFQMSAGEQALVGFPILIAITLAAYVFSTLNLLQREVLEGQHLLPYVQRKLKSGQQRRIGAWDNEIREKMTYIRQVEELGGVAKLLTARQSGNDKPGPCIYAESSEAAKAVAELDRKRQRYDSITVEELGNAIDLLAAELEKCPVDKQDSPGDLVQRGLLNRDHETLRNCIKFSNEEALNSYTTLYNHREFNYSRYWLAPTAMGNIAESVRSYARSRYEMNLDPFWSRLQKVLLGDEKFYSTLVDAKTQLDFMISIFWLTVCITAVWSVTLLYLRRSLAAFLIVAVLGPVLSVLWYRIALQNYRAFADILRSSIDLYRFQLLDNLHVGKPCGTDQERRTWADLNQIIGYGQPGEQISYSHPQQRS